MVKMSELNYNLSETFLKIVRMDRKYSIFLLEGEKLIFFPAWPKGEWNIGDVHHSSRHRRAGDTEMEYYFKQIAPDMDWREAATKLWRSVDVFGKEGSVQKEEGIKSRILKW